MSFTKILAAIDFSTESREALRVAAATAALSGGELTLLHVVEVTAFTLTPNLTLPGNVVSDAREETSRILTEWRERAVEMGARHVTIEVATGIPWNQIVETLRSDPTYDLVVLGTHGRTGLAHVLVGSVAEKVVRHAPCPVLVVRARR